MYVNVKNKNKKKILKNTSFIVITFTEVASLNHEVFHNAMEQASFVVKRFLGYFTNAFLTWKKIHPEYKIKI